MSQNAWTKARVVCVSEDYQVFALEAASGDCAVRVILTASQLDLLRASMVNALAEAQRRRPH